MVYSPRHIFVAYLFSAIIGVQHIGTALGQGAKTPKVVDPPLFLVYALEDLYKATLPNDAELFEGFVVRQQLQYDQLMLYISKQKKRDEELVGHFDGYRKVLEKVRDLAKEVEVCQKKHLAAFAKAKLKLQYEEMRQANAVLFSGLSQGFYAMSQGGSDEQAVRQGLSAAMLRAIDAQYQLDAARSEARSSFEKTMREFKAELNSFFPRKLSDLQKQLGAGPALSKELLERNGWPSETDFSAGREPVDWGEGDRPANPFWIERVILKRKPPEGIKAVEFHLRNAKELLWAARMIPAAKGFDSYRTRLYEQAGRSANLSSAAQLGTAGFKGGPTDAAKAGLDAWYAYNRIEPIAMNDSVLRHQYILAHAYGGKKEQSQAYLFVKLLMKQMGVQPNPSTINPLDLRFTRLQNLHNPALWYDAARITSLGGDINSSLVCFQGAMMCGFRDIEAAKVSPDLANLRAGAPDQFNKLITPTKKAR